ncbi:MAG: hypothetical protein ACXWCK_29415, partial [Burkholderiales bacterium]
GADLWLRNGALHYRICVRERRIHALHRAAACRVRGYQAAIVALVGYVATGAAIVATLPNVRPTRASMLLMSSD